MSELHIDTENLLKILNMSEVPMALVIEGGVQNLKMTNFKMDGMGIDIGSSRDVSMSDIRELGKLRMVDGSNIELDQITFQRAFSDLTVQERDEVIGALQAPSQHDGILRNFFLKVM